MFVKNVFIGLVLLLLSTGSAQAQLTAQSIKTLEMLGMQKWTVTVHYTIYHHFFSGSKTKDDKPDYCTQTGGIDFTAVIFEMPGFTVQQMNGLTAANCISWSMAGNFTAEFTDGCTSSVTLSNDDLPVLAFDYKNDNNWTVSASSGKSGEPSSKECQVGSIPSWTFNPNDATLNHQKTGGFTIGGNYFKDTTINNYEDKANGGISVTMTPGGPATQWEAIITPVDKSGFEKWLPLGPKIDGSTTKGNNIQFKIVIRGKNDSNIVYVQPYTINWMLENVTQNEGYCGNYPAFSKSPDVKPDLRFDDSIYLNNKAVASRTDAALTSQQNQGTAVNAYVTCYDYGAFGNLGATVTLYDGTTVNAISYRKSNKNVLTIPCDDNSNQVADYYEKQQNIYNKNYGPGWDGEKVFGKEKGDGITLFEEYRGFVLEDANGNHVFRRLSPDTAELFYHTIYGEPSANIDMFKQGAAKFGALTGLNMIYVKDITLLGNEDNGTYPTRKLNFNKCVSDKYTVDALMIKSNHSDDGDPNSHTQPIGGDLTRSFCPTETDYIAINTDNTFAAEVSWMPPMNPVNKQAHSLQFADSMLKNTYGTDVQFANMSPTIQANIATLNKNYAIFSTFHEFGHAAGMRHHSVDQLLSDEKANDEAHQTAIGIGQYLTKVKNNLNDAEIGKTLDALIAKIYQAAGYAPIESQGYFTQGDERCPMLYWNSFYYHPMELLLFFSGKWNPASSALMNQPWQFCPINQQEMHLHQ